MPHQVADSPQPLSPWQQIARRPYTIVAIIFLIYNAVRFMVIKDFQEWDNVFVLAARHLRNGADIYKLVPQSGDHAYSYPPFMAMLAIPFTWLPVNVEKFIWFLINALCIVFIWKWSWRLSGGQSLEPTRPGNKKENLICILGLACAMLFIQDTFNHRQTDLVIFTLLLAGCAAWQNARSFSAATFFGLAAAMKGPPLLFAPYLLWRGRWLSALWLVCLAIAVNLLPDLIHWAPHGIWLTQWYDQMIKPISSVGDWHANVIDNQSLAGAARRFFANTFSPRALKYCVYLVEISLLTITALIMGRPFRGSRPSTSAPTPAILECCMVMILMLLLSPMSSKPHFCVLLLPAFCVARLAVKEKNRIAGICLALCLIFVIVLDRMVVHTTLPLWYGSIMWSAAVLWIGCLTAFFPTSDTARQG